MELKDAIGWFYLSMQDIKSDSTIIWYKARFSSLGDLLSADLQNITLNDLRLWRAALPGHLSTYTIHGYIRSVKRLFHWLLEEGYIDRDVSLRLERPSLPHQHARGISAKNQAAMIAAAKSNPRDYALLLLLRDSGCRLHGLASLTIQNLDLSNCRALVWEKGRGGNHKSRFIFYTTTTAKALSFWLDKRPCIDCDNVFLGFQRGRGWKALTTDGIYQILERIAKRQGIDTGFNPHNWRHARVRQWLQNGMNLAIASQLAGHSSVSITADIYGIITPEELALNHAKYTAP
jgi:site-specific recombinase XerD